MNRITKAQSQMPTMTLNHFRNLCRAKHIWELVKPCLTDPHTHVIQRGCLPVNQVLSQHGLPRLYFVGWSPRFVFLSSEERSAFKKFWRCLSHSIHETRMDEIHQSYKTDSLRGLHSTTVRIRKLYLTEFHTHTLRA